MEDYLRCLGVEGSVVHLHAEHDNKTIPMDEKHTMGVHNVVMSCEYEGGSDAEDQTRAHADVSLATILG